MTSPITTTNQDTVANQDTEAAEVLESRQTLESLEPEAAESENPVPAAESPAVDAPLQVPRVTERDKLLKAIPTTSYKDLPTLQVLHKRLADLIEQSDADADQTLADLQKEINDRLSQHDQWQKSMIADIEASVTTLEKHLAEGRLREAQSLWDRNQNLLKKLTTDDQQRLAGLLTPLHTELTRLLDWKKFASSEKKRELIEKMQILTGDQTAPAAKARLIRALQDEWKLLGHSDDNDELWTQFSDVAKVAFEPCKIYFKERKELQASNLIARVNICEQLEAYAASVDAEAVNLPELTKLEHQAREDWKRFAPVAQTKIKNLQQRFNDVLSVLKQHKRSAVSTHNAQKQALVDQAKALTDSTNLPEAIEIAKQLQNQWKALGPGSFKDDRKYWTEFRAACDALFARRDNSQQQQRQLAKQQLQAVRDVLNRLDALLALPDEAFADSRADYQALDKAFHEAMTADIKQERKALSEAFNKLSRKYDARLKATPDKKVLGLLHAVQSRAAMCEAVENALLSEALPAPDSAALHEQWQVMDKVSDSGLEEILVKRFRQLDKLLTLPAAEQIAQLSALSEKLSLVARTLCVDAEIMCGVDTPAADKAIRMQQQLNQLQKGLGRLPATLKERQETLQRIEMQIICSGPMSAMERATCLERLQKIRKRI
jgi:DNA repair protein SbcC/Rad50